MADPASLPPLPKNHLDHPENWATGTEPATDKQKGFIKVLEGQHPDTVPEGGIDVADIGKSEASEVIDKLKNGQKVTSTGGQDPKKSSESKAKDGDADADAYDEMKETEKPKTSNGFISNTSGKPTRANGEKRKSPPTASAGADEDAPKEHEGDDEMKGEDEEAEAEGQGDEQRASKKPKTDNDEEKSEKVEKPAASATNERTDDKADEPETPAEDDAAAPQKDANGGKDETIPGDGEHLDHPENWATGDEPATEKQKGFLAVLEKKAGEPVENMEGLGKSEASAKIDELK